MGNTSLSILVVDDEPSVGQALARALVQLGHEADYVDTPELGLSRLRGGHFDLAITDVLMPGMDGIDFITAAQEAGSTTPIIAISGSAEVPDVVELFRAGAADFLQKPGSRVELRAAIERLLENSAAPLRPAVKVQAEPDLVAGIRRAIDETTAASQVVSASTQRLLRLSDSADPEEVFGVLQAEARFGPLLMRGAQSAAFAGLTPPGSPREATARLGSRAAFSLTLTAALRSSYADADADTALARAAAQLSLQHAVAARLTEQLAEGAGCPRPDLVRTATGVIGLVDLLMLRAVHQACPDMPLRDALAHIDSELSAYATEALLRRLDLPPKLAGLVARSTSPAAGPEVAAIRLGVAYVQRTLARVQLGNQIDVGVDELRWCPDIAEPKLARLTRKAISELEAVFG